MSETGDDVPISRTCAKCASPMEEGVLLDQGSDARMFKASWVALPVEKSFWSGLKLRGKTVREVQTFRCRSCGYLESFAS